MTCFQCGKEGLVPAEVSVTGIRNGEEFQIRTAGYRCASCGFQTIDNAQSAAFTQLVSDAYRQAHDLLTSAEIRRRRTALNMSQQEFADYLPAGVASVKRWELGQVQDQAMDVLIRLKTDPSYARQNLELLVEQSPEQCVLSTIDETLQLSFSGSRSSFKRYSDIRTGTIALDLSAMLPTQECAEHFAMAA